MRLTPSILGALLVAPPLAAQVAWVQRLPPSEPSPRQRHALAYDPVRERTVLFGGNLFGSNAALDDTWEWDGHVWRRLTPAFVPAGRGGHAMAYDPVRGTVLLFGGLSGTTYGRDTWEWTGAGWSLQPVVGPSSRAFAAIATDPTRGHVVMWGGRDRFGYRDDLWSWDGARWQQLAAATPPPADAGRLAYDAARDVFVLCLGDDQPGQLLRDVWEWDPATGAWTHPTPPMTPPPTIAFDVAYDPVRAVTIAFGGGTGPLDTWAWDGTTWTLDPAATRPAAAAVPLVWDAGRARVVSFGGDPVARSTWELVTVPLAAFAPFGSACPGTAGSPSLSLVPGSLPVPGETLVLALGSLPTPATAHGVVGRSDAVFGPLALPFGLDPLGMSGCALYTSIEWTAAIPTLAGQGAWLLPIPNLVGLYGEELFVQAVVGDPGANPARLTVTNAGKGTIGAR